MSFKNVIQRILQEQQPQAALKKQQQESESNNKNEKSNTANSNKTNNSESNTSPIYIEANNNNKDPNQLLQQDENASNLIAPQRQNQNQQVQQQQQQQQNSAKPDELLQQQQQQQQQQKQKQVFGSLPQNLVRMPELGNLLTSLRSYFQRYLLWMVSVCPTCPSVCNFIRKCFTPSNFASSSSMNNHLHQNVRPIVMNSTIIRASECVLAFGDSLRRLSLAPRLCAGSACWPLLVSVYSCLSVIGACETSVPVPSITTSSSSTSTTKTCMTSDQVVSFYATSTILPSLVLCWNSGRNYSIHHHNKNNNSIEDDDVDVRNQTNDEDEEESITFMLYHLIAVKCCDPTKKNSNFVTAKLGAGIMLDYENIVQRNSSQNNNNNKTHNQKSINLKKRVAKLLNVEETEIVWPDLKRLI
jgi:hypothetical protein